MSLEERRTKPDFGALTTVSPDQHLKLEMKDGRMTTRAVDLFCPIGKGTRGLIVAPPRTGKTILLRDMALGILENNPECHVMILLVDERPEEVTDFRRSVPAEIWASSNDEQIENHIRIADLCIERAKRLVEAGRDVVLFVDSITRLSRAHNTQRNSGRTGSGGLDVRALERPRQLFAAARKTEEAGSLTIIASVLVETGSRMDDVIFQEFKGTGNMELVLDRKCAEMRLWPAINIAVLRDPQGGAPHRSQAPRGDPFLPARPRPAEDRGGHRNHDRPPVQDEDQRRIPQADRPLGRNFRSCPLASRNRHPNPPPLSGRIQHAQFLRAMPGHGPFHSGHNLDSIQPDGTVLPTPGEQSRPDEPGHVAFALGEYYRATGETTLKEYDIIDLAARCVTAQMFTEPPAENGLAYAALGLLCFGPSKERNPVWERLVEETQQRIDRQLLHRSDYDNHWQAFNVAKAVARFSFGLSKKDETSRLIERMVDRINQTSSAGFFDDSVAGLGGNFNLYGVMALVFIRSALQLHANSGVRDRKLPTLRTYAEKYIRMMPDLVRADGLGWAFGRAAGAYGQMHCVSLILQGLRDGWIPDDQRQKLLRHPAPALPVLLPDLPRPGAGLPRPARRRAHGLRDAHDPDGEFRRRPLPLPVVAASSRRSRCPPARPGRSRPRTSGPLRHLRQGNRKEQGLFLYRDAESGLHLTVPLISCGGHLSSDALAFPTPPGSSTGRTMSTCRSCSPSSLSASNVTLPAFYGKNCVTGLGMRNSFFFRYEQPDLITTKEEMVRNLGSVKVQWTFSGQEGRLRVRLHRQAAGHP